jgi:P-type E1-E2 ATPase
MPRKAAGLRLQCQSTSAKRPAAGLPATSPSIVSSSAGRKSCQAISSAPREPDKAARRPGSTTVSIAVDGAVRGHFLFADRIRADAPAALGALRAAGISRIVLVTGDRAQVAESVSATLSVDQWISDSTPEGKVRAVEAEIGPTLMVGDGINDAPDLAKADVGVALGARGSAAASEAADVIVLVDRLERIAEAMLIARRTRKIAIQSVAAGLGLSFVGMIAAALGYLTPIAGALVQEGIDVAVVANALRALRGATGSGERMAVAASGAEPAPHTP